MARLLSPPTEALGESPYDFTEEELRVIKLFKTTLSDEWEMFLRPYLNGVKPDVVVVNSKVGVGAFLLVAGQAEQLSARAESLRERLALVKDEILALYLPRTGKALADSFTALVTVGIISLEVQSGITRATIYPDSGLQPEAAFWHYNPISGSDALQDKNILTIFPEAKRTSSYMMNEEIALDFKSWLVEPDYLAERRTALRLDADKRRLAHGRMANHDIEGPAGSGKSLVIAARAEVLSSQSKDVLVLSFNITLPNYLRELAKRYPNPLAARTTSIVWLHFHDWCKRVCSEAGLLGEYKGLWRNHFAADRDIEQTLGEDLLGLVEQALDYPSITRYDAILVDESQDFEPRWLDLVRKALKQTGPTEYVQAGDKSQDIYERPRTGFRGPPVKLKRNYRLPIQLIPHIRRYVEMHLKDLEMDIPVFDEAQRERGPVALRWIQIDKAYATKQCYDAVITTPGALDPSPFSMFDVCFLSPSHEAGIACMEELSKVASVSHTFSVDKQRARILKHNFRPSGASIHGSTIHSFKGWEARSLVIYIDSGKTPRDRQLLYIALTRLKAHSQGNVVTVVCGAPELENYGRTWSTFERRKGGETEGMRSK